MTPVSQQKMVQMETYAEFPYLIEITEPNGTVHRYANSSKDITFEEHLFESTFFTLSPPERTQEGIKDATITISTIDQTWIEKVRNNQERFRIRFIAVITYDENNNPVVEKIDEINFVLTRANWNQNTLQWTMKYDDWMDINIPITKCTAYVTPAIF